MDWLQSCEALGKRMFALAGCDWMGEIVYLPGERLTAALTGSRLTITAPDLSAMGRGLFLSACALKEGKAVPTLDQHRHFPSCGMMVDMSRGGVMTVPAVKELLDAHAALGLNLMMLYTEDTYPVKEYPFLGYLRGRYTEAELKELDAYALGCGVELVPCIQTLAHMEQFLQWADSTPLKDNDICLLVDEPRTYDLIRAELESVKRCFRSRRVHIGMDEAHGVGLGTYYARHGATDRFQLLTRHLGRVVALCEELELSPIMWSDMFYRLGSKTNGYYDPNAQVPPEVVAQIPHTALCYWDYYHTDEDFYAHMLAGHQRMGQEVVFAGGIWTWSGFLPHVKLTNATSYPALRACLKAGVGTVLATCWGDDGAETDVRLALNQLPIYSEHCWQGEACTQEEIDRLGAALTGLSPELYAAMGAFYPDGEDHRPGKGLFYADPLYPLTQGMWDLEGYPEQLEAAISLLEAHGEDDRCAYAALALSLALAKLHWIEALRPAYLQGDKGTVRHLAEEVLPQMMEDYTRFTHLWRAQWESARKRNGWETPCARMGALLARLEDTRHVLLRWVEGEIPVIEELEETPLCARREYGRQDYHAMTFPQYR